MTKVRVVLEGPGRGHTIMDAGQRTWAFENPWTAGGRPKVAVATGLDAEGVVRVVKERLGRAAAGGAPAR